MVDRDTPVKESRFVREWTRGPIVSNLLLLSWPMVLMETLFVVSQVADMVWVGRLGPAAIAGVGVANIVVMLVMSMDMGLIVGVRAMVARHVGAGDIAGANHIAAQALILSTAWGALMMTIGLLFARTILTSFGLEATDIVLAIKCGDLSLVDGSHFEGHRKLLLQALHRRGPFARERDFRTPRGVVRPAIC